MTRLLLLALLILAADAAVAQSTNLDALARRPGMEVTRRNDDGSRILEVRQATVTLSLQDGAVVGFDSSPHGAVLCAWEIVVGMKTVADVCFPGEFSEASTVLGEVIEAYDDFIVANSLTPVTKAELQARFEERRLRAQPSSGICRTVRRAFLEPLAAELKSKSRAEVKAAYSQTIAAPRPPVMNPCL